MVALFAITFNIIVRSPFSRDCLLSLVIDNVVVRFVTVRVKRARQRMYNMKRLATDHLCQCSDRPRCSWPAWSIFENKNTVVSQIQPQALIGRRGITPDCLKLIHISTCLFAGAMSRITLNFFFGISVSWSTTGRCYERACSTGICDGILKRIQS